LEPNEGDIKSEIKDNSQDIALMNKMDKIIFPTFSFQDAEIGTVINFLGSRSKTYDPDKQGITINNVIPPQDSQNIRVSVNFSYLPMSAAIRYICQSTGLTYSVNNGSLTIGTKAVIDDMTTKFFHNPGNLINYITEEIGSVPGAGGIEQAAPKQEAPQEAASERKSTGGASGGSSESRGIGEGTVSIARTNAATVTSEQLKAYFSKRGIKFPEGSAISYQPAIRKIMSRNTPENQADLEQLLRQIDADVPLIMVEIKSVEIGESDYQELGFEWSLHNLSSNMTETGARVNSGKSGWLLGQGVNAITGGALSALRGGTAGTVKESTFISNLNIFPALFGTRHPFGSDIPFNIGLTINAMSQNNRTETLNAPKLMTSSGSLASVDMVKEYYFPESWEEMEIEVETSDNSSKVTITPPVPEFGEATPIGIQFKVKPEMLNDRRTIRMTLTPKLTNFLRKDEWILSVWGVDRQLDGNGKYTETEITYSYKIWRPVISERNLNMVVDVYDGQTVVLGGMVQNETQSRIDKVPFFSELPFIGRFFQSHAENTVRNNLLIFVTARLVDNYGIPIQRNVNTSVPDFKR
jgi:type II secretory pathway component GspD/PulD (secretin)